VHQLIHSLVQGKTAETWIEPKEKKQDGRVNFQALQAHDGGKGSKSVCVKETKARCGTHFIARVSELGC
jgi:hypothetical protein